MDDRLDLDIQRREAIEAELGRRSLAHKRRVARLKRGARLRAGANKTAARQPLDFLAIGDSWFDYPLNGNAPSFGSTAIIAQLTQLGSPPPLVLNYALYGQATTSVLTYENQQNIIDAVTDPSQWVNDAPDGILVSMGGDDLVGDQLRSIWTTRARAWTRRAFRARWTRFAHPILISSLCGTRSCPASRSSDIATTTRSRMASLRFARARGFNRRSTSAAMTSPKASPSSRR